MLCGCASTRPRVIENSSVAQSGGALAHSSRHDHYHDDHYHYHSHSRGDECWDLFLMFLLFTWLFHH